MNDEGRKEKGVTERAGCMEVPGGPRMGRRKYQVSHVTQGEDGMSKRRIQGEEDMKEEQARARVRNEAWRKGRRDGNDWEVIKK